MSSTLRVNSIRHFGHPLWLPGLAVPLLAVSPWSCNGVFSVSADKHGNTSLTLDDSDLNERRLTRLTSSLPLFTSFQFHSLLLASTICLQIEVARLLTSHTLLSSDVSRSRPSALLYSFSEQWSWVPGGDAVRRNRTPSTCQHKPTV